MFKNVELTPVICMNKGNSTVDVMTYIPYKIKYFILKCKGIFMLLKRNNRPKGVIYAKPHQDLTPNLIAFSAPLRNQNFKSIVQIPDQH